MATKKTEAQIEFKAITSEFSSGIKDMNGDIKTLSNELKLNATQLKGNADDVDLLTERQNLLQRELQASSQKVELTNNSLQEAERLLGRNSTEYKNLYNQLLNAKNQQQAIQNELSQTTTKLEQSEKSWNDLDNAVDNASDGFTVAKGVMADLASTGIQSVISGVSSLAGSIYETTEATEEYRSMMAKLEGSSKSTGYSTEFATEKFDMFYKYLGDNQASTNAITNLMGLQTSQESLTALTEGAIGVWASYGDSIPIESLTESINETIQVGKVTGVMADSINWANASYEQIGKSLGDGSKAQKAFNKAIEEGLPVEDAFSEALASTTDKQERADIVAKFLNNTYGESKATYDELSGSILNANEKENEFQKTQATLGETISPLRDRMAELKTQGFEALVPFVEKVVAGVLEFTDWCTKNTKTIKTIGIIIGSLATAYGLVTTAVGIYNVVMPIYTAITTGASLATTALGGAIAFVTSPITIAVVAIGALIAIGVLLWENWDVIKEKAIEIWSGISEWFSEVCQGIGDFFVGLWQSIVDTFVGIGEWFTGIFQSAVDGIKNVFIGIGEWFAGIFQSAVDGIKNIFFGISEWFNLNVVQPIILFFQPLVEFFTSIFNVIKELAQGCWNAIVLIWGATSEWFNNSVVTPVKNFFTGLWNGIKTTANNTWQGIKNTWSAVSNWFNNSVVTPVKNFFTGLWNGIKTTANNTWQGIKGVWNAVSGWFNDTVVTPVKNAFTGAWDSLKNGASKAWEGIKTIFSNVASFFSSVFSTAWNGVKNIFSTGGKIFDGIKEGITSAFKTIVNGIIGGINKVVAIPFNGINTALDKIRNVSIFDAKPFSGLISRINVPQIPTLAEGNVATKPTLAWFGEYINARNNPEITTPESKMHDVFYSTLNEFVNRNLERSEQNNNLIEALENLNFNFYIDSERMATATASANDNINGERISLRGRGVSLA